MTADDFKRAGYVEIPGKGLVRISKPGQGIAQPANPHDGPENELHTKIEEHLQQHLRWYYVHSRTDKPTTQNVGVPDFIIAAPRGVTLWIEVKRKGGKLDADQNITRHLLKGLDHTHEVVFSMEEFYEIVSRYK